MGFPYHIWFTMLLLPHWLEAPLSHVFTPNVLTAVKLELKTWALIIYFFYSPSALSSVSSSGFSFCRSGPCSVFVDADGFLCLTRLLHAIRRSRTGCGVTLAPDHASTISVWWRDKKRTNMHKKTKCVSQLRPDHFYIALSAYPFCCCWLKWKYNISLCVLKSQKINSENSVLNPCNTWCFVPLGHKVHWAINIFQLDVFFYWIVGELVHGLTTRPIIYIYIIFTQNIEFR